MEIRREVLGEKHLDYANSLNSLAGLYLRMGNCADAEPRYRKAMEIHREILGEKHPYYAISLNDMAALYAATGREIEASKLMEQAAFAVTTGEAGYPSIAEADSSLYSEKSSLMLFVSWFCTVQ